MKWCVFFSCCGESQVTIQPLLNIWLIMLMDDALRFNRRFRYFTIQFEKCTLFEDLGLLFFVSDSSDLGGSCLVKKRNKSTNKSSILNDHIEHVLSLNLLIYHLRHSHNVMKPTFHKYSQYCAMKPPVVMDPAVQHPKFVCVQNNLSSTTSSFLPSTSLWEKCSDTL